MATAIGKSNLVQIFFISEGAKFKTILYGGRVIQIFLKVALILSLDSFIAASGKPTISIQGKDLL
jgi:hypothetical protein